MLSLFPYFIFALFVSPHMIYRPGVGVLSSLTVSIFSNMPALLSFPKELGGGLVLFKVAEQNAQRVLHIVFFVLHTLFYVRDFSVCEFG